MEELCQALDCPRPSWHFSILLFFYSYSQKMGYLFVPFYCTLSMQLDSNSGKTERENHQGLFPPWNNDSFDQSRFFVFFFFLSPSEVLGSYRLGHEEMGKWKNIQYFPHPFWALTDPLSTPKANVGEPPGALTVHTKVRFQASHHSASCLDISQEKDSNLFAGLVQIQIFPNSSTTAYFSESSNCCCRHSVQIL